MTIGKKVIVAIDSNNLKKSCLLIDTIKDHIFGIKIGYEFFLNFGLNGYKLIKNQNVKIAQIFLK